MEQEKLKELFKTHPGVKEFHIAGKYAFVRKDHAVAHAIDIRQKEIETVTRAEVMAPAGDETPKAATAAEIIEKINAAKTAEAAQAAVPEGEERKNVLKTLDDKIKSFA